MAPWVRTLLEVGKTAAMGLAAGGLALGLVNLLPQFVKIEHSITELRTVLFADHASSTSRDVAVVGIDENSLAGLPYLSPVDRGYMAALVTRIAAAEPRAIVLDISFDRRTDPASDRALALALRTLPVPVVILETDAPLDREFQTEFLNTANRPLGDPMGATTVDGVIRHIPPSENGRCSLAEATVKVLTTPTLRQTPVCDRTWPLRIDWLLEPPGLQTFSYLPANAVMTPSLIPGQTERLRGKVILIGGVFESIDRHKTALSALHADDQTDASTGSGQLGGSTMPGVMIHAQVLQQLLDGRVRHEPDAIGLGLLLLASGLAGAALSSRQSFRSRWGVLSLVTAVSLIVIDIGLFKFARFVLPGDAVAIAVFLGFQFNSVRLSHRAGGLPQAGKTIGEAIL